MGNSVTVLEKKFDAEKLLATLPKIDLTQLAVTHSINNPSFEEGTGSLYDFDVNKFTKNTADYTIINKHFEDTYMEDVIWEVRHQSAQDGVRIGRIRVMTIAPCSCYGLHIDPEEFRYHIPLVTNPAAFFVNGDTISRMPEVGRLYKYVTNEAHTAVNASFNPRIHILFDTYR
jgi:hypothetical protein